MFIIIFPDNHCQVGFVHVCPLFRHVVHVQVSKWQSFITGVPSWSTTLWYLHRRRRIGSHRCKAAGWSGANQTVMALVTDPFWCFLHELPLKNHFGSCQVVVVRGWVWCVAILSRSLIPARAWLTSLRWCSTAAPTMWCQSSKMAWDVLWGPCDALRGLMWGDSGFICHSIMLTY